jgi:iron complex transport system permease protein
MQTGLREISQRNKMIYLLLALLVIVMFSFCVKGFPYGFNTPMQVVDSIRTWIRIEFAELTDGSGLSMNEKLTGGMPYYGSVLERIKMSAMTFICGALMALSGSIFQTVFRNPMAAPTMLGVSTGVNVGVLILVLQAGAQAYNMMDTKYVYCYTGAMVMLAIVLAVGKLSSGRNKMSVFDLLIVAAIISQVVGAVITFYTYGMENDEILVYQEISGALEMDTSVRAFAVLGIMALISIVPMLLMRFSFNAVAFENDDSRSLGVNAYAMKIITMVLGTVMITAAMVHCGSAGMVSLIAPFISRAIFGAEFRKLFWGNLVVGGGILLICKDVIGLIPFGEKGIPLGTIVDFVVLPIFVIIVASQRRVWE